jgi:ferric-dicitrate binding protein FerR (iron transport regulator)
MSEPKDFGGDDLEALLRQVGTRDEPPPEFAVEVRDVVHAEWRAAVEEQRRERRRRMWSIAASVAALAIAVALIFKVAVSPISTVATVAYVDGVVNGANASNRIEVGEMLHSNDLLRTNANSRASLDLGADLSLRLDVDTTLELLANDRVRLERGAIYVDSRGKAPLLVETDVGAVRHLGTQYQVRRREHDIEVSVREGRIEVRNARGSNTADAGERLRVTAQGNITRSTISRSDASWAWVTQAAPVPDIENETLDTFLRWFASETGRRVVYASPQVQQLASTIRLHGSIRGLDPQTALDAVLQTTELRRYETKDELIGITRAEAIGLGNSVRPTP